MIRPDTDALIDFLNEVAATDAPALVALIHHRVPCSAALADHPSVQVSAGDPPTVGLLGILNGYCGTIEFGPKSGWGPITAVVDEDPIGVRFCRTVDAPELLRDEAGTAVEAAEAPVPSRTKPANFDLRLGEVLWSSVGRVAVPRAEIRGTPEEFEELKRAIRARAAE